MRSTIVFLVATVLVGLSACDKPAQPAAAPGDGKEVVITDANFQAEVLDSKQPVLVDIWATWCGPCRNAAPTIEALAKEYAGKVKVGKLDYDASKTIAPKYAGNGIPVFLLFKGGKLVHQSLGFDSDKQLRGQLVPAINAALK
jgi:thioredoxin 1